MKRINKNKNEYNTNFNLKAYNNSKYSNLNVYYIDLINNVCYNKLLKFLVKYYDFVNSILLKVKIKDLTSTIVKPQKISYAFILSILIINTFFSLFFNLGNYSFVNGSIMGAFQGRLIQTTTDDEMWNSYVNLGMTRTYIDEEDTLEEVQEKVKKSCVYIHLYENNGLVSDKAHGSGFIIDITKNKMYIATCRHVCYLGWGPKNGFCILFSEEELNKIWKENNLKGKLLGTSGDFEFGDFGIIEVDISNLSYEDKICFKKAPINKEEINIEPNTKGYFYHITKNGDYLLKKIEILPTNQSLCFSWAIERLYSQCTYQSMNGDSGSYYFDENGNIIGLLVGMTGKVINGERVRRDHIIKPNAIFEAYEKIVGETIN